MATRRKAAEASSASPDWIRFDAARPTSAAAQAPAPANAAGDPPTVDLDGPDTAVIWNYFENGYPVPIAINPIVISAAGGILSLEIHFRPDEYVAGDTLSIEGILPGGITAELVAPDRLVLRGPAGGTASTDDMETALTQVRYSSTAANPNGGGDFYRSFNAFATDANGTGPGAITYVAVRDEEIPTEGDDYLEGSLHDDTINGLGGNDYIYGRAGNDRLDGGTGNDFLHGDEGDDILIVSGAGYKNVDGGAGFDTLIVDYSGSNGGLTSPYANDQPPDGHEGVLSSEASVSPSASWSLHYERIERIELTGTRFADAVLMAGSDDIVWLGAGDDYFLALGGTKIVHAGTGNDTVYAGLSANDWMDGGDGIDTIRFTTAAVGVTASLAIATAQDTIGGGIDTFLNFERMIGSRFADQLTGDAGDNRLSGGGGSDTLTGGGGADVFAFENTGPDSALGPANIDTVTDFELGADRLLLGSSLFGGLTVASLAAGAFRAGTAAQDADDRIVYDAATGALYFDADGDGAGAAVQFASIAPGLALGASDFIDFNRAPEAVNSSITLTEDQSRVFALADFGYTDADGDGLGDVRIVTLPASGKIFYDADGAGGPGAAVAVAAGQYFPVAEIAAGRLSYVPAANASGAASTSFAFTVRDAEGALDTSAAQMVVHITPVADAPTGADWGVSMREDGVLVLSLADFPFSDVDGETLAAVIVDSVAGGTLRLTDAGGAPTTLSGFPATVSAADIAAGRLAFLPDANGHGGDQGAILFRVSDGTLADALANLLDVSVQGVNDAPSGTDNTIVIAEDGSHILRAADFGFSDPVEGHNFYGVRIASLPVNGTLVLNGVAMTGVAGGGTLVSSSQLASGQLVFRPDANGNGDLYASFTFRVRDSGSTSNGGIDTDPTPNILTFAVTSVNDAPVVTASAGTAAYLESVNAPPALLAVDSGLTLADPDDAALVGATVSITANLHSNEDLLVFSNTSPATFGNIGATYDSASGVLSLASAGGTATLAQWQAALRNVAYSNTSDTPDEATRILSFAVDDGETQSNIATRPLSVAAQEDGPPAITGTEEDDVIDGTPDADVIDGLGGHDDIDGHGGDDLIWGGAGNDDIIGGTAGEDIFGAGDDELHGGEGNDRLADTDGGNDEFYGEAGDDELDYLGGSLPDIVQVLLDGGAGDDAVRYTTQGFENLATLIGGVGHDQILSFGGGHVEIDAGADSDLVTILAFETDYDISLGSGADLLFLYSFTFEPAESDLNVTVGDFAAGDGGDALVLVHYLPWLLHGWDFQANPFATGHLRLEQRGADAVLQLDRDAAGAEWGFVDLVVLENVAAVGLTAHNLGGYAADGSASAAAIVTGTAGTDFLTGRSGDDEVRGLDGNDTLFGGGGDDLLLGGAGRDNLIGDLGDDELRGGDDEDTLSDATSGDDELYGEGGRDLIVVDRQAFPAPAGNVLLDGGDGDDDLIYYGRALDGDATLRGGADDDLILAFGGGAIVIDGGDGAERITIDVSAFSYAITFGASAQDSDILELAYTSAPVTAFTILDFTAGNGGDLIEMESFLQSYLFDWDGVANPFGTGHLLLGQNGADALILVDRNGGGDNYAVLGTFENVDAAQLTELNVDFLPGPVARVGTSGNDSLIGTAGGDHILGFSGNDFIDGLGGADAMEGGSGDDVYIVDNAGDVVVERADEGNDIVYAQVSYALTGGSEVETLAARDNSATTALALVGNEFANTVYGNNGANFIDGGAGADALAGFGGNDAYVVDDTADRVFEDAGRGNDVVYATASYALGGGSEIETLAAQDNSATTALALIGNEFANTIYGNNGANFIDGNGGADALAGFGGDDAYVVDTTADRVFEDIGRGNDIVYAIASFALGGGSEIETLAAQDNSLTTAINLVGNEFANTILGNAGANFIDGNSGADILIGFGGNDYYMVDNAGDQVFETSGGGTDIVYATASYALTAGSHVETLSTIDSSAAAAIDLTGNERANTVIGNNGANVLNGGGGNDVLLGFGGADTFAFATALGAGNVDQLLDFLSGTDRIALDDAVFAGLAPGTLGAGAFVTGAAAADADDRIVYNNATGALFFDADGNGAGAAVQFATLSGAPLIVASDFVVI